MSFDSPAQPSSPPPLPQTCSSEASGGEAPAAASQRMYTARPRWSHDDDDSVTVVQSTLDYTQRIFTAKPQTARWVRGLAEDGEDDYPTGGFRRRRANMSKWEELDDAPDDDAVHSARRAESPRRQWLFYPNLLAIAYLCFIALRIVKGLHRSYRLDYPTTPRQLEPYGRKYGENGVSFFMRVAVPLAVPHACGAAYTLGLSYMVGGTAHNLTALCGVGLSLLSLGALFTQCSLLFACCGVSPYSQRWECEVPFVFHHICTVVRVLCPLLAAWCVSPVLDQVRGCGYRWRCVLAVPCLAALTCLAISVHAEVPSESLLDVAHGSVLLTWPLFLRSCWRQRRFVAVARVEKPHED
ncbi:hypothetical protein NESM_000691600 [Novymonas esmeraldas]|uniref:Uncharacterized protein n=1 Tax=Novymonas esmeraldas TaxID=1808958 RepID=A0AAW0EV42_9TRYP